MSAPKPKRDVMRSRTAVIANAWFVIASAIAIGTERVGWIGWAVLIALLLYVEFDIARKWDACEWGGVRSVTFNVASTDRDAS